MSIQHAKNPPKIHESHQGFRHSNKGQRFLRSGHPGHPRFYKFKIPNIKSHSTQQGNVCFTNF